METRTKYRTFRFTYVDVRKDERKFFRRDVEHNGHYGITSPGMYMQFTTVASESDMALMCGRNVEPTVD